MNDIERTLMPYDPKASLMGMRTRRPWRRCATCRGVCYWHDEAWVCRDCGDEFYPPGLNERYKAPGDCPRRGCEFPAGHEREYPCGVAVEQIPMVHADDVRLTPDTLICGTRARSACGDEFHSTATLRDLMKEYSP